MASLHKEMIEATGNWVSLATCANCDHNCGTGKSYCPYWKNDTALGAYTELAKALHARKELLARDTTQNN